MATQTVTTQTDPVCGMQVDPTRSGDSSEHAGEKYYFCCSGCKSKFDKDPNAYLGPDRPKNSGGCCCA